MRHVHLSSQESLPKTSILTVFVTTSLRYSIRHLFFQVYTHCPRRLYRHFPSYVQQSTRVLYLSMVSLVTIPCLAYAGYIAMLP
ncbi:hypothetical protein BD310DRAFT_98265 [Dichomitus squalens]|uniref:Uncharacterized protein n=1 Tax=Dichomitus squalens TaxID=114155 RepID=A0A4Q9PJK4_9APHY|nr:hypothetical protein BD310DRAFT_98265 [Dichomitus squalens]